MKNKFKYILILLFSFSLLNTNLYAQKKRKKTKHSTVKKKVVKKQIKPSKNVAISTKNVIENSVLNNETSNLETLPEKVVTILSEFKPQLKNLSKIDFDLASERKDTINLKLDYQVPSQNLSFQYRPISLVPRSFKLDTIDYIKKNTDLKFGYGNYAHQYIEFNHNYKDISNNDHSLKVRNESFTGFHPLQKGITTDFNYLGSINVSDKSHLLTNLYVDNTVRYRYGMVSENVPMPMSNYKQNALLTGISLALLNNNTNNGLVHLEPKLVFERFSSIASSSSNFLLLKSPFSKAITNKTNFNVNVEYSLNQYKKETIQSNLNQLLKIEPSLNFTKFGSEFKIGMSPMLINGEFNLFPVVEFKKALKDTKVVISVGWHANVNHVRYANLTSLNPWIAAPEKLAISTQDTKFIDVAFAKGKRLNYGFAFSLNDYTNFTLFNLLPQQNITNNGLFFASIFEKKASTIQFDANLRYQFSDKILFTNKLSYLQFNALEINAKPWGIIPFSLNSKITWMPNKKWQINGDLQYWGGATVNNTMSLPVDLDNVMLLNASLTYNFNTRFSFWLKGDNLLDKTYQRWLNYPSLGVQIIGGVVYSFK